MKWDKIFANFVTNKGLISKNTQLTHTTQHQKKKKKKKSKKMARRCQWVFL